MSDHERYAEWDAAYVLGALGAADRREFEGHLSGCLQCRSAVAELAAMPGLLGALPASDAFALLEPGGRAASEDPGGRVASDPSAGRVASEERARVSRPSATGLDTAARTSLPTRPPEVPGASIRPPADLLARLHRRIRRTRRIRSWTIGSITAGLAAAAIVVGLVLPSAIDAVQHPAVELSLQQTVPGPVTASVRLTSLPWGTSISMTCTYHGTLATYPGYPIDYRYGLYVVDNAGVTTRVSSWTALPDRTITTEGSTATPVGRLVRVELRDLDSGTVLLTRKLG